MKIERVKNPARSTRGIFGNETIVILFLGLKLGSSRLKTGNRTKWTTCRINRS